MQSKLVYIILLITTCAVSATAGGIYLKSGTIDTDMPKILAAEPEEQIEGMGYFIVLFDGPIQDTYRQSLIDNDAQILEYLPDFAYLIRIDRTKLGSIKSLESVKWVGAFKPEYKSSEDLSYTDGKGQFVVMLFPGAKCDYAISKAGVNKIDTSDRMCRVLATGSQLSELAETGAVSWIEPYVQPTLCNNIACEISGVPEVRSDLGLYGSGEIIGVADTGLDTGSLSTISSDFAGRITKTYALRRTDDWSDLTGHGTHVAGSILGSGALSGSDPASHDYDSSFAGMAPEADMVFQSIGDDGSYVFPPLDLADLFQPAYDDGARVHNNSWGSAVDGQYTTYSNEVDQFVWDHKDFTVVFAVGNEGEDLDKDGVVDLDSLYAPSTAKNCISVGATENYRTTGGYQMGYGVAWSSSYPVSPIKYDLMSNNIDGMAAFSGRGPTDDGRIKPDVCAPGTNIISCRSHISSASTGWGAYNSNYTYNGGTSMSAPHVTGLAALIRQYYQQVAGTTPSAALVKATLINGAVDITPGQYGSTQYQEVNGLPDYVQGWGRVNIERSLNADLPTVTEFADESSGLSTNGYRDYQYNVVDNSVPLKFTLVWTDYPGAVHAAIELVNDLDLIITSPNDTVYQDIDRLNNVEQIILDSPETGTYTVRVKGYNVPMGPQDYALVVSGGMPSTYISGSVTSATGAVVQGSTVSIMSSTGTKRVVTNQNGKYLSRVEPGTYSVQVGMQGWTFTPRGRVVNVTDQPVENVNFVGQGQPGGISGTVTSAIGGVISHIVESPHPYLNNYDRTYTITANDGVSSVRVHFAEIDLLTDGDEIYVLDGNDNISNIYTGKAEDLWSSWVDGNVIKIRILTNETGNTGYGFYIDGYETDLVEQGGLEGATITLRPGGYTATTLSGGSYTLNGIPAGTYTVTPSKDKWTFDPSSKISNIPADGTATGVNFTALPPGSISGRVQIVSPQFQSINVESAHPYDPNYENTWQIDADESATRMRLHFAQLTTEPAWDYVYIMNGSDEIIEIYTDDYTDLWTPWIDGHVARVMLTSDSGNEYYGFKIDKYEAEIVGNGLKDAVIGLNPDDLFVTTSNDGAFDFGQVSIGTHTLLPELDPWAFDPESQMVSVSAGVAQDVTFYVSLNDIERVIYTKSLPLGIQITLNGAVVSGAFDGFFYVQDTLLPVGIRVDSAADVSIGDTVTVNGTLALIDGERVIQAVSVE
ncbi:S8 family serine peptidase [bacterium]|nr:S8 family serine peptidase [bacterium]